MISVTELDDSKAQRILSDVARARANLVGETIVASSELRSALCRHFGVSPSGSPSTPGELARQALLLLSQDPETKRAIAVIAAKQPSTKRDSFDSGATVVLGAAVLFALRTQIEIARDKSGQWTFKLKTKSMSESTLRPLVEKLISYLP